MDPLAFLSDLRSACTDAAAESRQIARAMENIRAIETSHGISKANFIAILFGKITQRIIGKSLNPTATIGLEVSYPETIIRGESKSSCYVDMAFSENGFWLTANNHKFALIDMKPLYDKLDGVTEDAIFSDAEKLRAIKEQHEPIASLAMIVPIIGRNEIATSSLDVLKEKLDEVIIC